VKKKSSLIIRKDNSKAHRNHSVVKRVGGIDSTSRGGATSFCGQRKKKFESTRSTTGSGQFLKESDVLGVWWSGEAGKALGGVDIGGTILFGGRNLREPTVVGKGSVGERERLR